MHPRASESGAERKFREWASLFPEKVLVGITLYADETGIDNLSGVGGGSKVVGVGGYMATTDEWEKFSGEWQDALTRYGVSVFHMTGISDRAIEIDPQSPYRGWSRDKKDCFILDLAAVARANIQCGICSLTPLDVYNSVVPDWLKQDVENPYNFCLQGFFQMVVDEHRRRWPSHSLEETQVAFVFEQQPEFGEDTLHTFLKVKRREPFGDRMGTIAFAPKEEYPLQAADLLVGRMRKAVERVLGTGELIETPCSWDAALGADGRDDKLIVKYHDESSLREVVDRAERDRHKHRSS